MSTSTHDIYDPPPAPVSWVHPAPEPIACTRSDLACLILFYVGLFTASVTIAWTFDLTLGTLLMVGGALVILESWFTALSFLQRKPEERPLRRCFIMLAALVPWAVGLGVAALVMVGLFVVSDLGY